MKIISFNVNGIRAITTKSFLQDMLEVNADIICLQETKATEEQVKEAVSSLSDYHVYAHHADKKGTKMLKLYLQSLTQSVMKISNDFRSLIKYMNVMDALDFDTEEAPAFESVDNETLYL